MSKKDFCCILRKNIKCSNRSIWVPKWAEFHANFIFEDKIEKKCTNKESFKKKLPKNSFFRVTFLSSRYFFQFCLRIWNQRKILRFLVPIFTNLKKHSFLLYFVRNRQCVDQLYAPNFCGLVSVGETQYIHAQRCWVGGGDAKFLLKCHALCPICLKTLVVLKVRSSI